MPDYGAKLPTIVLIGQQFKKNGIIYEVEAQITSSVLNKRYGYRKNGMETN